MSMTILSGRLLGTAAEIARGAYSEHELRILFLSAGLADHIPDSWYGKPELVASTVESARRAMRDAHDVTAADVLREALDLFVRLVAQRAAPGDPADLDTQGTPFHRLREAARSDGFDLIADCEASDTGPWRSTVTLRGVRLLPLDEPRAPIGKMITVLENDFVRLGMTVALRSYQQAVASLVDQRFESSNAQMRAMFEAVLIHFASQMGFTSTKQGAGGAAIRYLVEKGQLPQNGGGDFIRGLWNISHTNGPHPGTSDAGEASFRLQALTAASRYLIDRFAPNLP